MCKVNMLGYPINVDYGAHVKQRLRSRFDDMDIAYLEYRIEEVFSDEAVADHLMNEVKIGEDVILIDEDSGITFAVNVGTDTLYIMTVYNAFEYSGFRCGDRQQVLKYAEKSGFRPGRVERKRGNVYA